MVSISGKQGRGRVRVNGTSIVIPALASALLTSLTIVFLISLPRSDDGGRSLLRAGAAGSSGLSPPPSPLRFNPILRHLGFTADTMFDNLLLNHPYPTESTVVIEVGCYRLSQSAYAAKLGYRTLSFDASPENFAEMRRELEDLPPEEAKLITLRHRAVTDASGGTLTFSSIGGTGDHVSSVSIDQGNERYLERPNRGEVRVPTAALDDVIAELAPDEFVHLLKIDVQGHEASVFDGLAKTLPTGRIRYILFEYWVDALDEARGRPFGTCSAVDDVLVPLVNAGYELFDLSVVAHPKAGLRVTRAHLHRYYRPLGFRENCRWFAERGAADRAAETEGGGETYKMGYWTDILAVYGGEFSGAETAALGLGVRGRSPITTGLSWAKDDMPKRRKYWEDLFRNRAVNANKKISR